MRLILSIPDNLSDEDHKKFTRDFQELCDGIAETFELARNSAQCFLANQDVLEITPLR